MHEVLGDPELLVSEWYFKEVYVYSEKKKKNLHLKLFCYLFLIVGWFYFMFWTGFSASQENFREAYSEMKSVSSSKWNRRWIHCRSNTFWSITLQIGSRSQFFHMQKFKTKIYSPASMAQTHKSQSRAEVWPISSWGHHRISLANACTFKHEVNWQTKCYD